MRRWVLLAGVLLCVLVAGCFGGSGPSGGRYSIVIRHGSQDEMTALGRGITPGTEAGHVYASDPDGWAHPWYAWAIVTDEQGQRVDAPAVEWSTDIEDCIVFEQFDPVRPDRIRVMPFEGSEMGRGKLFAKYQDSIAEMLIFAYGWFGLESTNLAPTSVDWSFAAQGLVGRGQGDLRIVSGTGQRVLEPVVTIEAPYGLKRISDLNPAEVDAFFEQFESPTEDGFSSEGAVDGVYEVISADGTHYKLAPVSVTIRGSSGGSYSCAVEFAWDYYR